MNMAKSTLTAGEFIQKSFSPFVAVLCSPSVDEICQENNLSFIELLEPFCVSSKEVCYKEPTGNIITLKNFQIVLSDVNSKPPEAAVARRYLNESVSMTSDENTDSVTVKSGSITVQVPSVIPWFEKWRTTFLRVQFPSDHEFFKHYIACMIVITSQDDNPMDMLSTKVQQLQQMLSMSPPKMMPKWFSSSVLRYYVLLHDSSNGDVIKAEKVYDEMKSTYNANCCYMLKINSLPKGKSGIDLASYWKKFREGEDNLHDTHDSSMTNSITSLTGESLKFEIGQDVTEEPKPNLLIHPLSPELESQRLFNNGAEMNGPIDCNSELCGSCLSSEDIDHIKMLVLHFFINALMPFVETQMQYLNEMVFNKKVGKSLFSVPRRWFGGPKPGSPVSVPNTHYYHPDSPELQMRRLGDLCFMFGAYSHAFQAYHSVKRDFNNDGAWLYYAGALEMTALSAFLIGHDLKKAQEYTDEGVKTYLQTCRMPQFATRLTLCATECLKTFNLYGEAAGKLLLMTSEESDLRSALLLEEASYCFLKSRNPPMPRKFAFHLVLAGHRFAKANQKKHALRCYRQAYQVYQNNNWGLAEDHIHFTIGKLASSLKQKEITATEFAKLFTKPSAQLPAQQAIFLKEYFLSLTELKKENNESIPFLEIPRVDHTSIKVALNTLENEESIEGYILAGKNMSEDELNDVRWGKLEEKLHNFANKSSMPSMFFKQTINIFSSNTNNSVKPTCVVAENIRTSVDLVNILNIPLSLKKLELTWMHSALTDDPSVERKVLVETEVIDSVSLDPDSVSKISLHLTPKVAGELHITGITYTVILPPASDGTEPLHITGHTLFTPQGMRVISTKDQKTAPVYLPDYRLQLVAVSNVPRLKVLLKNVPFEMLCGELKEISVQLQNVGSLPIQNVLLTSSELNCFSAPGCASRNNIFSLINEPILPGHSIEVTIFLRGCDKSGRVSIDLLFYCNVDKSSQQKLKYRLIHHTLHILIHESVSASALVSRSVKVAVDDTENVNIKLQVHNKNQFYDSVKFVLYVHHISLFSSHWKLIDVIPPEEKDVICLEQEQAAFLTLKAKRMHEHNGFSNLVLCAREEKIWPVEKPRSDFAQFVIDEVARSSTESSKNRGDCSNLENIESAVTFNSLLTIFWKAELKDTGNIVFGQHHIPLIKLLQKYTSCAANNLNDTQKSLVLNTFNPSSIASLYYSEPAAKELVLIRLNHPAFVRHSFSSKRICSVPVELLIQNCCDNDIEVKLDSTYQTNSSVSKINEFSSFLWMGLVLHTFVLKEHSCTNIRLSACFGNSGTYDLASHFSVSARKDSNQVFVSQILISHSLLCITNEIL